MISPFDARPIVVALAGPNGAGKTTFFQSQLQRAGLRFVNADDLARELDIGPYDAAGVAAGVREALLERRESFVFETVFSDPSGDKLQFLLRARSQGYAVVLCFIGLDSAGMSDAIRELPHVLVFDNSDLRRPFRKIAEFQDGRPIELSSHLPAWLPWRHPDK